MAVAVGIAGAGGAAVYAASTAAGAQTGRGGGPMIRMGPMEAQPTLHGESVVKNGDGEYVTQLTQTGAVTEIDADSVTARSEDGYTRTYVVGADTVAESIEIGDEVMIMARLDGETATAESVIDTAEMPKGGRMGGPALDNGPGTR